MYQVNTGFSTVRNRNQMSFIFNQNYLLAFFLSIRHFYVYILLLEQLSSNGIDYLQTGIRSMLGALRYARRYTVRRVRRRKMLGANVRRDTVC